MLDIPINLVCSITNQIFKEPVFTADGHTYEKEAIAEWLQARNTSPKTGTLLVNKDLTPNWDKIADVNDFMTKYPNAYEEIYFPKAFITLTLEAIAKKNANELKQLIEKDKRLLYKTFPDKTLITLVCEAGVTELLKVVLAAIKKNGINFSAEIKTSLLITCYKSMSASDSLKIFITDSSWDTEELNELLKTQIAAGNAELVSLLLKANFVSINSALDDKGNTALHFAALNNQQAIVKDLMMLGAHSKLENKEGYRPEKLAMLNGHTALASHMLEWRQAKKTAMFSEEVKKQQDEMHQLYQQKILFLTQENQKLQEKISKLKNKKPEKSNFTNFSMFNSQPQLQNRDEQKPQPELQNQLIMALLRGNLAKVRKLESYGASFLHTDTKGLSPLVAAVYSTNLEIVKYVENKLRGQAPAEWLKIDMDNVLTTLYGLVPTSVSTMGELKTWYNKYANAAWRSYYDEQCLMLGYTLNLSYQEGVSREIDRTKPSINLYRNHGEIHALVIHSHAKNQETVNLTKLGTYVYLRVIQIDKGPIPTVNQFGENTKYDCLTDNTLIKFQDNENNAFFYFSFYYSSKDHTFGGSQPMLIKLESNRELLMLDFNIESHFHKLLISHVQNKEICQEILAKTKGLAQLFCHTDEKLEECLENLTWPMHEKDDKCFKGIADTKVKLTNLILSYCNYFMSSPPYYSTDKNFYSYKFYEFWSEENWQQRALKIASDRTPVKGIGDTIREGGAYVPVNYTYTLNCPDQKLHEEVVKTIHNNMSELINYVSDKSLDQKFVFPR